MSSPLQDAATQLAQTQASAAGISSVAAALPDLTQAAYSAATSMSADGRALAAKQATVASLQAQVKALGGNP